MIQTRDSSYKNSRKGTQVTIKRKKQQIMGVTNPSCLLSMHRAMGVKSVRTSPYHPQTDGLVERYNRTFKELLRRTIESHKREWDVIIPYVLFAYREVPQESTGFSPFELVYGRDVRGPLDVLREEWIQDQQSPDDVLTYVTTVRERLDST